MTATRSRLGRAALVAALALSSVAAACAPRARYARGGELVSTLSLVEVDWNPTHAAIGRAAAVADDGEDVVVFGDAGAQILAAGAPVANDGRVTAWRDATTIAAADGSGTWIVGVDARGRVLRVRGRSRLEEIGDRYSLDADRVTAVAWAGERRVAFALAGGANGGDGHVVALADGRDVRFYDDGPIAAIAAGAGKLALLGPPDARGDAWLRVIDLEHGDASRYALPGAKLVAVDRRGRVHAASDVALWSEDALGALRLRYVARAGTIGALVASGDVAWFREGRELGRVPAEDGDRVEVTSNAPVADSARLFGSSSGDVWVVSSGQVRRLAHPSAVAARAKPIDDRERWEREIRPVFVRNCSACHLPGGGAGIDLSTYEAWSLRRSTIHARVIEKRTMPPGSRTLQDADRDAIDAWTKRR